jgi:type I restriction enzyme R subunit
VRLNESTLEQAALAWLKDLGYTVLHGPDILAGEPGAERSDPNCRDVCLERRLRGALVKLNPDLLSEAIDDAFHKLTRLDGPSLIARNQAVHRILVEGVTVEYTRPDGSIAGAQARVLDFDTPDNNDWLAVNQFTVVEGQFNRRPDVVLFVNGLPLAVIELKNPADENATLQSAFRQFQTYQSQIPSLFAPNVALVVSDGLQARIGAVGGGWEWFKPWRTISGREDAPPQLGELQVLLEGVFEKHIFLNLLRHFVVFEDLGGGALVKKIAGYHQFHAVNVAVAETLRAAPVIDDRVSYVGSGRYGSGRQPGGERGDRRVGVVWHTQGSGKSLTMAFYAGRIILHPAMKNPTVVVLTDRNDLDEQLFGAFSRCKDLLRQTPTQAVSREDLRRKLNVGAGGVVFTTIQKFLPDHPGDRYPPLSNRGNIVVIADEAHRSQYDFVDGFAAHLRTALPNASFIGFTGTPIERADADTRRVFGDYISVYDIQRAVTDGATVRIYYESRLAKLNLKDSERPMIDPAFEDATEGEELEGKEKLKTRWAQLEALVGSEDRIRRVAGDFVDHFEKRLAVLDGKAMLVGMSRRICVALYREIVKLRPAWHGDGDEKGAIKVVMTGSASDPLDWQDHIRNKPRREAMAKRFRDPNDPFKIVIVRDMWLTGFDAPSLHTMYVDKPMRGHGLMQAIARVNRVFKDKPGGLVVDYLGLAQELKQALATYTESGGTGGTAFDQTEAVAEMMKLYEVCLGFFHGFDRARWGGGSPRERFALLPAAQEHVLAQEDGKSRFMSAVTSLSRAFALAVPNERAQGIRDDVAFFQAVRTALAKTVPDGRQTADDMEHAIRQIVSQAIVTGDVVDIFAMAGLKKPDISILSDEFLAEVRGMPHKNLAVELLRKLLSGEIKSRFRRNVVQARSFAELLEQSLRKYQNRAIETVQVIEELISLAKDLREAEKRGQALGLSEDEKAFYDALEVNNSAVEALGEPTLKMIARELVSSMKGSITIDWTVRENIRAQLRILVKRILRKHGYPPDKQEQATKTVLEQAEVLSEVWAAA